jgi:hypothetical protein
MMIGICGLETAKETSIWSAKKRKHATTYAQSCGKADVRARPGGKGAGLGGTCSLSPPLQLLQLCDAIDSGVSGVHPLPKLPEPLIKQTWKIRR